MKNGLNGLVLICLLSSVFFSADFIFTPWIIRKLSQLRFLLMSSPLIKINQFMRLFLADLKSGLFFIPVAKLKPCITLSNKH